MRRLLLWLCLACCPLAVGAADAPAFDLDHFMRGYFEHPEPDKIAQAMDAFADGDGVVDPEAARPVMAFFSQVFAANPDRMKDWQADIDAKNPLARGVLLLAVNFSHTPDWILQQPVHSAVINDMYWSGYFATGDARYVQKLVDQLVYCDERTDLYLYLTGATAQWSLAGNAAAHPAVKALLQQARDAASGRQRELLEQALTQAPGQLHDAMSATAKAGFAAKAWKDVDAWRFDLSKVLGVDDSSGKQQIYINFDQLDQVLDGFAPHVASYPPRFADDLEKEAVMVRLDTVVYFLDSISLADADYELMRRAGRANAMAYNVDLPGSSAGADAFFLTLLKHNADDADANYEYGSFLGQTGNHGKDAIPYLLKARELGELRADYTLGYVYITLGDKDDGIKYLERYVAEAPDDKDAKDFLDGIKAGKGKIIH